MMLSPFTFFSYVNNVHDSLKFSDDIEMTVAMHVNLIHWTNFRNYAETMLTEDTIRLINGAAEYKKWVSIHLKLFSPPMNQLLEQRY